MNLSWCYLSTATPRFDAARLDELYADARRTNERLRISGVLLYCNGRFCQLVEGPRRGMQEVVARIRGSALHADLIALHEEPITLPVFPSWSLGTAHDWRGARMETDINTPRFEFLTPAQRRAHRVLLRFVDWEDEGAQPDFALTRQ